MSEHEADDIRARIRALLERARKAAQEKAAKERARRPPPAPHWIEDEPGRSA